MEGLVNIIGNEEKIGGGGGGLGSGFQDQHAFCTAERCLANFPF